MALVFRCSNNNNKVVEEKKKMQMFFASHRTQNYCMKMKSTTKCEKACEIKQKIKVNNFSWSGQVEHIAIL